MDMVEDRRSVPGAEIHDITGARMTRRSPVLEEAWRYWSSLRRDGRLPERAALDPGAMKLILGHSMVLDRVRPGSVRVRLGGRVPNALMGMETRGLPIRAFFDLMQRNRAIELMDRVFDERASLELDLSSEGDEAPLAARMMVLPLADRDGQATKALAVLVPDRVVSEGPRRFVIERHHLAPVLASLTDRSPGVPLAEAAEDQAPYMAAPQSDRAPWLRVVK